MYYNIMIIPVMAIYTYFSISVRMRIVVQTKKLFICYTMSYEHLNIILCLLFINYAYYIYIIPIYIAVALKLKNIYMVV